MKHALKSLACPRSSSASVVDGKLILSFPNALTPVVWQMDLTQAKASALEVREDKDGGAFMLTLKKPEGETTDIASFEKRTQAVEGLMAASKALENAHGHIRPVTGVQSSGGGNQQAKTKSSGKWIPAVIAIVLLVVLFGVWGSLAPYSPGNSVQQPGFNPASTTSPPADTAGVPISADDFLRGR